MGSSFSSLVTRIYSDIFACLSARLLLESPTKKLKQWGILQQSGYHFTTTALGFFLRGRKEQLLTVWALVSDFLNLNLNFTIYKLRVNFLISFNLEKVDNIYTLWTFCENYIRYVKHLVHVSQSALKRTLMTLMLPTTMVFIWRRWSILRCLCNSS